MVVLEKTAEINKQMNNRYLIEKVYEIAYFNNSNLSDMAEKICFSIKKLNVEKIVCNKLSYSIQENQLIVTVSYKYFAFSYENNDVNMQKYNFSIEL